MIAIESLDRFNLTDHGDRHEHQLWELVRDRFPNYEVFWRYYVVPLTNRTGVGIQDSSWIRMRSDVPPDWEKVAICHYSVFYYLSRAAQRRIELFDRNADAPTHPEDVVYLLQTCCENVHYFYNALRAVAKNAVDYLPRQCPTEFPFRSINAYRNLLLHNPVLGRGESDRETLLPKIPDNPKLVNSWVSRFKFSWTAVERLDAEHLVSAHYLVQSLEDGLAEYLDRTWAKVITDLGGMNLHSKFRFLRVPPSTPNVTFSSRITVDSSCINVNQPLAASGTFNNLRISKTGK